MRVVFIVNSTYGIERIGVQILASIAKEEGYETFFYSLDTAAEDDLIRRITVLRPEVVAYSCMTYEHIHIQRLNRRLKSNFQFISIFGGPHYTFSPEEIDSDEYIDVVCIGEGENAFRSFLKHVNENSDYSSVNNLIVRSGKMLHKNAVGPLIENLDTVPFADMNIISVYNKESLFEKVSKIQRILS